jgi:hypothetical protein
MNAADQRCTSEPNRIASFGVSAPAEQAFLCETSQFRGRLGEAPPPSITQFSSRTQ